MSTQPIQIDSARAIMRGQARDLLHNRKLDDAAIAEANKAKLEQRQQIPWLWRMRGTWGDWWDALMHRLGKGKREVER